MMGSREHDVHADAVEAIETGGFDLFEFIRSAVSSVPQIDRILVFGSRARGDERKDSDIDILITYDGGAGDRHDVYMSVAKACVGTPLDKDLVIMPTERFSRESDIRGTFSSAVENEGVLIYG